MELAAGFCGLFAGENIQAQGPEAQDTVPVAHDCNFIHKPHAAFLEWKWWGRRTAVR